MKDYRVVVTEERVCQIVYVVEAESEEEAIIKAEKGETITEGMRHLVRINNRTVDKVIEIPTTLEID